MKTILLFMLLLSAARARAQVLTDKKEPVPEYIHITPDISRAQIDSIIQRLKQWNIELSFETLEYDPATGMIAIVNGTVINNNGSKGPGKGSFHSSDFKDLTIVTTKDEKGVATGIRVR